MKVLALVFTCAFFLLGNNIAEAQTGAYRRISPVEANQMMNQLNDFILLDVRNPDEFRDRRIEGAILIPVAQLEARAASELPNKNAVILIYCLAGGRSLTAARALAAMGYTRVYDFGGILSWPFATVSGD